ncbi:hypothetical protein PMAYCL1PPCAC_11199, partial [Pristionchus mayeri]
RFSSFQGVRLQLSEMMKCGLVVLLLVHASTAASCWKGKSTTGYRPVTCLTEFCYSADTYFNGTVTQSVNSCGDTCQ